MRDYQINLNILRIFHKPRTGNMDMKNHWTKKLNYTLFKFLGDKTNVGMLKRGKN